jgi:hypothetical protein
MAGPLAWRSTAMNGATLIQTGCNMSRARFVAAAVPRWEKGMSAQTLGLNVSQSTSRPTVQSQ